MTALSLEQTLTTEEQEQLRQTIEMFEVITQANPHDTQSMEILKEAYHKLGQQKDCIAIGRRLADTYMELGQYSSALLEYEGILQKEPDNAEIISALGEVEQRLHHLQIAVQAQNDAIALDFKSVVKDSGNLMVTGKTQATERLNSTMTGDSKAVAEKLSKADDGNDQLVKFLLQHRLAPEDIVTQSLHIVRKKNSDRLPNAPSSSLLDEIVTRGSVDPETLLCGILDRSKFAYIPLECYDIDRQVVRMLPDALTLGRLVVPFDVISRTMMVAIANPFDAVGKEAVQQLVDYNIQWHLASPAAIMKVLQDAYR
jgi:tetratricopeptide (TPR) repeat protein